MADPTQSILNDDVLRLLKDYFPFQTSAIAAAAHPLFKEDKLIDKKEEFDKLLLNMITAYGDMYRLFRGRYPDGVGGVMGFGDDLHLSVMIGDEVVLNLSQGGELNILPNAFAKLFIDVCTVKMSFIHDSDYKCAWVAPYRNLLDFTAEVDQAKLLLNKSYNDQNDKEFIKFIVAHILISKHKTVFKTTDGDVSDIKIDSNGFVIIDKHFETIEQFPVELTHEEIDHLNNGTKPNWRQEKKEFQLGGPKIDKQHLDTTVYKNIYSNLKIPYEPIKNIGANIDRIKNDIKLAELENITGKKRASLTNLAIMVQVDIDRKIARYNAFFQSIILFTQFVNQFKNKHGGKKKVKSNQVYVKTNRKYTTRNKKHSNVVYTRGNNEYIRVKKDGVYGYKKIK